MQVKDAKDIITKFKSEDGYVTDIDSVLNYLKEKKASQGNINKVLLEILEWNDKCYKQRQTQTFIEESQDEIKETPSNTQLDKRLKEKDAPVCPYVSLINSCYNFDLLTDLLPSEYDGNFEDTITQILLALYKDLCYANNELKTASDSELEFYKKEVDRTKQIIDIVKNYADSETLEDEEEQVEAPTKEKNKLIFLGNENSSSCHILSDIDDINIADYDFTLSLINDLINGTPKREKRFQSPELKGISAVRKKECRIIFVRLNSDKILILGILTKRFQNSENYQDFLERRANIFRSSKETYKAQLDDTEFLDKNEAICSQIKEKLSGQNKKRS